MRCCAPLSRRATNSNAADNVLGSLTTVESPVELDELGKAAVVSTALALGVDASSAKAYSIGCGLELEPDPERRLTLTERPRRVSACRG